MYEKSTSWLKKGKVCGTDVAISLSPAPPTDTVPVQGYRYQGSRLGASLWKGVHNKSREVVNTYRNRLSLAVIPLKEPDC
jgi:hypothetical protein